MRRATSILVLLGLLALNSGAVEYLHNRDHDHAAAPAGAPEDDRHHHDESTCQIHAVLGSPLIASGWTPLLVCLGLFVAFLTSLPQTLAPRRHVERIDCRGPPAC